MLFSVTLEFSIFIIFLLIPVIIYGIYFFYSAYINKKNNLYVSDVRSSNTRRFVIKVDLRNQAYTFIFRGNVLPSVTYNKQKFEEMFVSDSGRQEWKEWLKSITNETNANTTKPLLINIIPYGATQAGLIRVELLSKNQSKGVIFFQGSWLQRGSVQQINKASNVSAFGFRQRINDILKSSKIPTGAVVIFNFNHYDYMKKRYDQGGVDKYLASLWNQFAIFDNGKDMVTGLYKFDAFLVYGRHLKSRKDVQLLVAKIITQMGHFVGIGGMTIETNPAVGYSNFGEFSINLERVMRQAYNASVMAHQNKLDICHYDSELDKVFQNDMWLATLLKKNIKENNLSPQYEPIISLKQGKEMGSFASIDYTNTEFNNFETAYKIAFDNGFEEDFLLNTIRRLPEVFNERPENLKLKLFVFCRISMLAKAIAVVEGSDNIDISNFVVTIVDYNELINHAEYLGFVQQAKQRGVKLAIIAHKKMETIIHPILKSFTYLIWSDSLIKDVLIDERVRILFNNVRKSLKPYKYQEIARGIDNYELAEFLKSIGIVFMAGHLLTHGENVQQSSYSIRRVNKLIGKEQNDE